VGFSDLGIRNSRRPPTEKPQITQIDADRSAHPPRAWGLRLEAWGTLRCQRELIPSPCPNEQMLDPPILSVGGGIGIH
jgi:hypothetical protein